MLNLPKISNKKFGIEVEFVGACPRQVARVINEVEGVECSFAGYTHLTTSYWKVVSDASLNTIRGYAGELVSPILQGTEGVTELFKVLEALNSVEGVTVNRSCGLHVHLDCREMNINEIKTVFSRYEQYEEQIDLCMPRSRRGNPQWCAGTSMVKNSIKRATTKPNAARAAGRYYKVNLTNIHTRGSMEFRQHSGTTEFKKIVNWLSFLMQFVESSIEMAASSRAKRPSAKRIYSEVRNVVENAGGTMVWNRFAQAWNVTIDSNEQVIANTELNTYHRVTDGSLTCDGATDFLERFNCFSTPNFQRPQARAVSVSDSGIYHGITNQIQDYLAERQDELA
ncbi:MAG: amidoligase family protein [Paracoccaceae bacterium]